LKDVSLYEFHWWLNFILACGSGIHVLVGSWDLRSPWQRDAIVGKMADGPFVTIADQFLDFFMLDNSS
jgi:hypothetical protein